jgi:hypothetical protein
MVISNIGTIVVSLPPSSIERSGDAASQASTAQQVKLLSLSNTISRISVGLIADFVSPVASLLPSGVQVFPQRHRVTRVTFLSLSSLVLAWTFWWASSRAVTRDDVWVLRYSFPSAQTSSGSPIFSKRRYGYRVQRRFYCPVSLPALSLIEVVLSQL